MEVKGILNQKQDYSENVPKQLKSYLSRLIDCGISRLAIFSFVFTAPQIFGIQNCFQSGTTTAIGSRDGYRRRRRRRGKVTQLLTQAFLLLNNINSFGLSQKKCT